MTVSDSSPLIALARSGSFHLLLSLFSEILIPPAVFDDVVTRGAGRPGEVEVREGMAAGWMRVQTPTKVIAPPYGPMRLGEIQALSLARELRASVLIDEEPARRRAAAEGVFLRGTVDVLVLAKNASLVPAVRPLLDALLAARFSPHAFTMKHCATPESSMLHDSELSLRLGASTRGAFLEGTVAWVRLPSRGARTIMEPG